jgi:hypothetical protein
VFGKKVAELVGTEVYVATTLTGGGVVKPGVGKYPKVLGLSHMVQLQERQECQSFLLPKRGQEKRNQQENSQNSKFWKLQQMG